METVRVQKMRRIRKSSFEKVTLRDVCEMGACMVVVVALAFVIPYAMQFV